MQRKMKVTVGGKEYDALELDFEIVSEQWNEYKLLDGGRVRIKTSPQRIFRILDEDGNQAFTDQRDPFVIVRHNTQIVATD